MIIMNLLVYHATLDEAYHDATYRFPTFFSAYAIDRLPAFVGLHARGVNIHQTIHPIQYRFEASFSFVRLLP